MTLFIPLCAITTWNHNELKYALRSWDKYSEIKIDELLIIGHKPGFLKNFHHIEFNDKYSKTENIFRKIQIASFHYKEFIYANDDHYLVKPLISLPYYHSGLLKDFKGGGDTFMRYVSTTTKLFPDGYYFDVHTPMIVEQDKMKELSYVRDTIFKSVYCNTHKLQGLQINDCKTGSHIREQEIPAFIHDKQFISTSEAISTDLKKWMEKTYPEKSRWEV